MQKTFVAIMLALCLLSTAVMAAAGGVAQVTGVKGTATLTRAGKAQSCGIFTSLQAGDHIQVSGDSQVTLFFYGDSHREVIPGAASFSVTATGTDVPAGKKTVSQTPGALKVAGGSLQGLNSDQFGGSVKRGGDVPPIKLLNGPNVLEATPTLRWDAVPQAVSYSVEVQKDFGEPAFIKASAAVPSYPVTQALERGKTCVVKIVALGDGGKALNQGTTLLQVLSDAQARPLQAARQEADKLVAQSPDDLSPYVTLAAGYLHEGLTAEAVDVLAMLADKAPDSAYPHDRMAALYKKAGLTTAAADEQKKAATLH